MKNNVRQLRVEKGLTQAQLAQIIGITRTSMINIESRLYDGVNKKVLEKLSDYFQVSPLKILGLANLRYFPETEEELDWLIEELNKEKAKWAKEDNN